MFSLEINSTKIFTKHPGGSNWLSLTLFNAGLSLSVFKNLLKIHSEINNYTNKYQA